MSADPKLAFVVRSGPVVLRVVPVGARWRWEWRDGETRRMESAKDRETAKTKASNRAHLLANGAPDVAEIPMETLRALREWLELRPTPTDLDEFLRWKRGISGSSITLADAVAQFCAEREANRGRSNRWADAVRRDLARLVADLGGERAASITTADLIVWTRAHAALSAKRRADIRQKLVQLWKWMERQGHVPRGQQVADALPRPRIERGTPETFEPIELRTMLRAVSAAHLPWLALSAFAGLRSEELTPPSGSGKSPLDWSDILWQQQIIRVRPETAKTGRKRIVPLSDALRIWLHSRHGTGAICPVAAHHGRHPETTRLAVLLKRVVWPRNALRHSFISYRAALVGLGAASMEAGNSEAEARRSYNDAKSADDAAEWFGIVPTNGKRRKKNAALGLAV